MLEYFILNAPRPNKAGFIPLIALGAVYLLTREMDLTLGAHAINGLGLAALAFVVLVALASQKTLRHQTLPVRGLIGLAALLIGVAVLAVWAPSPRMVQEIWTIAALLFALAFGGFTFFGSEEDLRALPSRWAFGRSPRKRAVMSFVAARHAFDAMVVALLMRWASLDLWVAYVTLGRLGSLYLCEFAIFAWLLRLARE